jgi:hypothetical protein
MRPYSDPLPGPLPVPGSSETGPAGGVLVGATAIGVAGSVAGGSVAPGSGVSMMVGVSTTVAVSVAVGVSVGVSVGVAVGGAATQTGSSVADPVSTRNASVPTVPDPVSVYVAVPGKFAPATIPLSTVI